MANTPARQHPTPNLIPVRRALLSVSDKSGLVEFAKNLATMNIELVSTGGTAKLLKDAGLSVKDVSELTQFPEMMDGRLKTLHPMVHGGLLAIRDHVAHEATMREHGIKPIDLLVVNLYPFEDTINMLSPFDECIENIDIGGPAMIRAAAKNHAYVNVVVDASDYAHIIDALKENNGQTPLKLRQRLAAKAYARTGAYDAAISQWFAEQLGSEADRTYIAVGGTLRENLRYGENPHQTAAYYSTTEKREGVTRGRCIQGKALSYNNINDTDAAFELVSEWTTNTPAAAIIKHANPCGVATGNTLLEAYHRALAADPISAFGGIIALNQALDAETAEAITQIFTEVVIAPGASKEAQALFAAKKNLRLVLTNALANPKEAGFIYKTVAGGLLQLGRDNSTADEQTFTTVTARQPSAQEQKDLRFALRVVKHAKSNAIVIAADGMTHGIGAGRTSRVDAVKQAIEKAKSLQENPNLKLNSGYVLASDAFFPFPDGVIEAANAGVKAIVQPGGSVKDNDVIEAANAHGIAMVFTGIRHFRH